MVKIVTWWLTLSLLSCKTIGNILTVKDNTPEVRVSSDIIINKKPGKMKVMISIANFTGEGIFDQMKEGLDQKIGKDKYELVNSKEEADLVITVNIANFYKVNNITLGNIKKQWIYNDSADPIVPKDVKQGTVNVAEKGVAFSNSEHAGSFAPQVPNSSSSRTSGDILDRVTESDFLAGMVLGGAVGFFVFGSSPLFAILFGLGGAGIGSIAEKFSETTNFLMKVNIDVAERVPYDIEYYTKYHHKEDQSSVRWHSEQKKEKWSHKRFSINTFVRKFVYSEQKAKKILLVKMVNTVNRALFV